VALDLHPGQSRTVTVQLSKTAEPLAIRLKPAKSDEEAALYRVRVRCGSVSEALALRPGETSAPLALPTGARLMIGVRLSTADDARTFVWDNVDSILADGQNPLTVCLPVTAEVRILLVDARGRPVHGAYLRLRRQTDDTPCFRPALSARTSADGIAVFPHLPLGDYAVSLTPVVWRRGPHGMRRAETLATFSVKGAESLHVRCAATEVRELSAKLVGPPSPERFEICAEYELTSGDLKPRTRKREMRSNVQPDGSWALALPSSGDEPVTLRLLGPARNVVATTVLDAGQSSHTFSIAEDGFAGAEVLVRDGRRIRVTGWLRLVREDEAHALSTTGRPIDHQTGGVTFEWLPVGPYVVQYSTELGRGDWRTADSVVLRRDRHRFEVDLAGVEGVRGR
jgi:hypothetical protein